MLPSNAAYDENDRDDASFQEPEALPDYDPSLPPKYCTVMTQAPASVEESGTSHPHTSSSPSYAGPSCPSTPSPSSRQTRTSTSGFSISSPLHHSNPASASSSQTRATSPHHTNKISAFFAHISSLAEQERLEKERERDAMWARIDAAKKKVRESYAREQAEERRKLGLPPNGESDVERRRRRGDWRGEQDFLADDSRRPVRLPFGGSLPDDFLSA